jgi:hypothetical protein
MNEPTYLKFLRADGTGPYSYKPWSLPTANGPGEWMPEVPVVLCESGYHATTIEHAREWLHEVAYLVELSGEVVDGGTKVVAPRARLLSRIETWHERSARHFAADCAERVLPTFEHMRPADDRPRKAIEAARAYADGRITAAAGAAARDAAGDAAGAAARDAAGAAARDAAWAAARAAARDAAWDAAWAAARAAARDAAWAAARDAAWDAEKRWQAQQLDRYLFGDLSMEPKP